MKRALACLLVTLLMLVSVSATFAQIAAPPALMNFQGRLAKPDGTSVANGNYNLRFSLFNALSGGTLWWQRDVVNVPVKNGTFATKLDFSGGFQNGATLASVFGASAVYLQISINGAAPLSPRQQFVTVAYAFKAHSVRDGSITTNSLADNAVTSAKIANGTITGADIANATITRDKLVSGTLNPLVWLLGGNAGTNGTQFVGTTDNQPLVLKVNNQRALQMQSVLNGSYLGNNLLGGYWLNSITSGVTQATVFGGGKNGANDYPNRVTDHGGTVSGGLINRAGNDNANLEDAWYATVGGGYGNTASGEYATVGGGIGNSARASSATVGGGISNVANGILTTVGGGYDNTASSDYATVGGGYHNYATGSSATVGGGNNNAASGNFYATVGGGYGNTATGNSATVAGGYGNTASGNFYATVGGGYGNTASGGGATVAGGASNTASGSYSFAAGAGATAAHTGAFVWNGGANGLPFSSTAPYQFCVRSTGGLVLEQDASPTLYTGSNAGEFNRYLQLINSPSTPSASGLKAGGILCSDSYDYASPGKNDLVVKGTVSIGGYWNDPNWILHVNGGIYCTNFANVSDGRWKQNVASFPNALDAIIHLRGVAFDWKSTKGMNFPEGRQIGFIAQEVEKVLPELVRTDAKGYKSVAYQNVVPVLVEAIKTQQKQREGDQAEVKALKAQNAELKARLEALAVAIAELKEGRK